MKLIGNQVHWRKLPAFLVTIFFLISCSSQSAETPFAVTEKTAPTSTPGLATFTPAPSPFPGGLYVDAGQSLGQVSPVFYGTNWGPVFGVPVAIQPAIPSLGLKIVRFPAGNWGDENTVSKSQIDMLMNFCKQWGAEPFFHVRLANSTPEDAAKMVRYVNLQKSYKVRFWGIGNEPDLFSRRPALGLKEYTPEQYSQEWRKFALAMKAVDPDIQFIGPEISQFIAAPTASYGQVYTDWLVTFLKTNGDLVDVVAVHRYPFPKSTTSGAPSKDDLRSNTTEWDTLIQKLHTLVREHAGKDLPVAVTEVNSSWTENAGSEASVDSHFNGIWFADILGRMIRQDTYMVQQFAISGRFGMVDRSSLRSTGQVFQLYTYFGNQRVYASSDQEYVSVYAARRTDGALTILVINLNSAPRTVTLNLANAQAGLAETWLFDQENPLAKVNPVMLQATNSLNLSPESVTLFILPSK